MALFLFILTLFLSALFSGSETAYVSSNRIKLFLRTRDPQQYRIHDFLIQSDRRFLTSTLVGNNVVMVACSSLAVIVFSPFLSESVLVLFTSAFLLLFGEILPKSIATLIPNRLSRNTPSILFIFYILFYPLIWLSEHVSSFLTRLLREKESQASLIFTKAELPMLVNEYAQRGLLDASGHFLFHRALEIGDKRVADVMVPRTEMIALEKNTPRTDILKAFNKTGFSRLPIFADEIDHIEGLLYVLDFIPFSEDHSLHLRPALFFPSQMRVMDALKQFKQERTSMAIVVDEHGGTAGLVTIEDIVEELFGSIIDEYDISEALVHKESESTLIADGRTEIENLRLYHNLNLPTGDYVTIGGLIEDRLGTIPEKGKQIKIGHYLVTVLDVDPTRIKQVRIDQKGRKITSNI